MVSLKSRAILSIVISLLVLTLFQNCSKSKPRNQQAKMNASNINPLYK
jgi:hypothetical protein